MELQPIPREPPAVLSHLRVLRKYRWLLITTSLVGAILASLAGFRHTPIYRASVQLLIERASSQMVKLPEILQNETESGDYVATQLTLLKSRALAREVTTKLALAEQLEFAGPEEEKTFSLLDVVASLQGYLKGVLKGVLEGSGLLGAPPIAPEMTSGADEPDRWLINAFLDRLTVTPISGTRMLTISFEGRDRVLITQIVNSMAEVYINRTVELKFNAGKTAMEWLRQKVTEERKKIEQAETALQAFRERENILSAEGGEQILVKKIAALNDLYVQSRVKRLEVEAQTQVLQRVAKDPNLADAFPLVMQNQFLQTLKANHAALEADVNELSERYGVKHPGLQRKELQLNTLKSSVNMSMDKIRQNLELQAQMARVIEDSVRSLAEETKQEVFGFHQKAIQYGVLQREVQAQSEIYNLLLKRLYEAGVTEQVRMGNASVIDAAEVPTVPINPKKAQKTMVGLLVGLGAGLGIAFGLNVLDTSVHTPDDIEQGIGLPFLGAISKFQFPRDASGGEELIVQTRPNSAAAEAFRNVRTSVVLLRSDLAKRALLITSVGPEEGKTLVVANLAVALALAGRRVLAVDADMRRPRLGKIFGMTGVVPGLVQVLGEGLPLEDAVRPTSIERLSLLICPTSPSNPSELLDSERLATLIASAKEQYDFVLFDSPPLMAVTDPLILAPRLDGVILVVKGGGPPRELLLRAANILADVNATLLGGVLNLVDPRAASYYGYGYKYYYAYKYYRKHYDRYYDRRENT